VLLEIWNGKERVMEQDRASEGRGTSASSQTDGDMVEAAGETTAAAANDTTTDDARPVGADTRVKVEGEDDSAEERE
jgi:hypothetical protein